MLRLLHFIFKLGWLALFYFSAQAQTHTCSSIFQTDQIKPYSISLNQLKNAFKKIDQTLDKPSENIDEPDWTSPHNAFFRPETPYEDGQTWRHSMKELNLTQQQIDSSWATPLYLFPMEIALYKGHLFPSAYFIRRTSMGNGLNRSAPDKPSQFAEQLPYAVVRGSSVEIYKSGGSRKLFELLIENHPTSSGSVVLYRAASKTEYHLQVAIQKLMLKKPNELVTAEDLQTFEQISASMDDGGYNAHKLDLDSAIQQCKSSSRQVFISKLIGTLGPLSGGIFTSLDIEGANGFKTSDGVILKYSIPISKLREMVLKNQVYVGIEYNYSEILFIDQPENQSTKSLLLKSLAEVIH